MTYNSGKTKHYLSEREMKKGDAMRIVIHFFFDPKK